MTERIEHRLRDAFAAGADLVHAETLRSTDRVPRSRPRLRKFLLPAPILAALAVVLVVSFAALAGFGAPPPVGTEESGPRYLLTAGNNGLAIRDALNGRITDRVTMPPAPQGITRGLPGGYLLTGTGQGTTFYVAQSVTSLKTMVTTTWFYRLRADSRGKLAELTRDVIAPVVGESVSSIAITNDGTRLAYSIDGKVCGKDKTLRFCPGAQLVVVDLPGGTPTRTWTTNANGNIWSLSWAADRRRLAFAVTSEVRVLDTAAPGETLKNSHTVVRDASTSTAVAISPDGRTILVGGASSPRGGESQRYSIGEYSVPDGKRIRAIFSGEHSGNTAAQWTLIRYDSTGRHLLVKGNFQPLSRLDGDRTTVLIRPKTPDAPQQELLAVW
ncbi:WD40 repeat domain-containing protein [Nonomuraea jiangxiensis]|uniref:WD40-like Beta Propeller Repeat n=1 Tax=Nonomuraea jiangxiensis TaxID=633440 RepID=A0A1G8LII0_9ACTN|nr:hypothetical protein [Nonomuraea jiangxiensis]SDI55539.1 hypothetical protein SAMN05421869_106106 [Nonomuraea jiangxiensis]